MSGVLTARPRLTSAGRGRGVGLFVVASLVSMPALAGQEVALQLPGLQVVVPDGWVYEVSDGADVFKDGGGAVIGKLVVAPEPCSDATARFALGNALNMVGPISDPPPGWSGWNYVKDGAPVAIHCRAGEMMGVPLHFVQVGYSAESDTLLRAYSAGLDALLGSSSTPGAVPTGRDAATLDGVPTDDIQLATLEIRIQAPADWKAGYNEYYDWVTRADGSLVAKVADRWEGCAETIAAAPKTGLAPPVAPLPGWTGFDDGGNGAYCRDIIERGQPRSAYVQVNPQVATWLIPAIDEALNAHLDDLVPTAFERYGPTRYEFGLARFDEDPDNLFVEAAWGVSMVASRPPWHRSGLTWSYEARLAATGAGYPGSARVGAGLNLEVIALQAIAGVGAAGGPAPLTVDAGGQFDLLFLRRSMFDGGGGFDFSVNHVWLPGGTSTRLQGGFILSIDRVGLSLCMGWEARRGTELITINLAGMLLPEL